MANDVWILVGFGPVLCAGSAVAFAEGRRAWRTAARVAFTRPDTNGSAGVPRRRRRRAAARHAASPDAGVPACALQFRQLAH